MSDKTADLAGPGISTYEEVAKILPTDYEPLLSPMETMQALYDVKRYIEDGLCRELNLNMVQVPLIVDRNSGVNDMLDRDGSRTPVEFPAGLGLDEPIDHAGGAGGDEVEAYGTQAQFGCGVGEGDLHRHEARSARTTSSTTTTAATWTSGTGRRRSPLPTATLDYLEGHRPEHLEGPRPAPAKLAMRETFPPWRTDRYPPTSPRSSRSSTPKTCWTCTPTSRASSARPSHPPGAPGGLHRSGSAGRSRRRLSARDCAQSDYDDWITETVGDDGQDLRHGLNGDILVWNPVTKRRHELTSMGVRVTKETLIAQQCEMAEQLEEDLALPYHQAILNDEIPLSIGGGIGQSSRTYMYLLRKAHLGEVSVTIWPDQLKKICSERNIHVLE